MPPSSASGSPRGSGRRRGIPLQDHVRDLVNEWSREFLRDAESWDGNGLLLTAQACLSDRGFGLIKHDRDVAFQWLQRARKKKDDTRTNVQALLLLQKYFPETLTEKEVDYLNRYYPDNVSDYGDDLNICPRRRPNAEFDSENDEPAPAEGAPAAENQQQPMSDE